MAKRDGLAMAAAELALTVVSTPGSAVKLSFNGNDDQDGICNGKERSVWFRHRSPSAMRQYFPSARPVAQSERIFGPPPDSNARSSEASNHPGSSDRGDTGEYAIVKGLYEPLALCTGAYG
jgi:hypothetical protein